MKNENGLRCIPPSSLLTVCIFSLLGVDLFALSGWIPERLLFAENPDKVRDHETPPQRAWEKVPFLFFFAEYRMVGDVFLHHPCLLHASSLFYDSIPIDLDSISLCVRRCLDLRLYGERKDRGRRNAGVDRAGVGSCVCCP